MGSCYRKDVMTIAESQLGYEEGPNNYNKYGKELSTVGYFNGDKTFVSWCGSYNYWCILKACIPEDRSDSEKKWDALYFTYQPSRDNCACGCKYGAQYFRQNGAWSDSAADAEAADIIFFGTKGNETHQGLVRYVQDGTIYTIEGNAANAVRHRSYSVNDPKIAGIGKPRYDGYEQDQPSPEPTPEPEKKGYPGPWPTRPSRGYFQRGDTGSEVVKLQKLLEWTKPGCLPKYGCDGEIGSETLGAVKTCQAIWGTKVDGFYGKNSEQAAKAYKQ